MACIAAEWSRCPRGRGNVKLEFVYKETEKTEGKVYIPIMQGGGEEPTKGGQGANNDMHHCRVVGVSKREGKV